MGWDGEEKSEAVNSHFQLSLIAREGTQCGAFYDIAKLAAVVGDRWRCERDRRSSREE